MTATERLAAKSDRIARLLSQVRERVGPGVWEDLNRQSLDSRSTTHTLAIMAEESGAAWGCSVNEAQKYAEFIRETVRPALLRDPHDIVIDELESILREACLTPVP